MCDRFDLSSFERPLKEDAVGMHHHVADLEISKKFPLGVLFFIRAHGAPLRRL